MLVKCGDRKTAIKTSSWSCVGDRSAKASNARHVGRGMKGREGLEDPAEVHPVDRCQRPAATLVLIASNLQSYVKGSVFMVLPH